MFGTLLESRAKRERSRAGTALSVGLHAALIVLAVVATARATDAPPPSPDEGIIYVPPPAPPAPPPPSTPRVVLPPGSLVAPDGIVALPLVPPIVIPDRLPTFDPFAQVTDARDFEHGTLRGREVAGSAPVAGGTNADPLPAFEVDRAVLSKGGCAPRFPDVLRGANVEGEVLAQFTVDAEGRVLPGSFRALRSSHELFTQAVRACLPAMRFVPAELQGRAVAQLVQQPFVFALERR